MPPLRKTYQIHPQTGEPGIWFDLTIAPGFVGLAETDWPIVPDTIDAKFNRATFEADLNAALQALCETRRNFADIETESKVKGGGSDNDPITKDLQAEPFCWFETEGRVATTTREDIKDYVRRVVKIAVEVKSINPIVIGNIRVSNGASRLVMV